MKSYIITMLSLFLLSGVYNSCFVSKGRSFIVTITEPSKVQEFTIPLSCDGWCNRGLIVLENTTDDSIRIGNKYLTPGQTGRVFSMEGYDVYKQTVWTYKYLPYKATKGKIVLKWYVSPE